MSDNKHYLGDGAYVEFNEHGETVLTTSDGIRDTNRIYLDRTATELLRLLIETQQKTQQKHETLAASRRVE